MQLEEILSPERCLCQISGVSKKRLLTLVSEKLAAESESLEPGDVFDALMAREQLGTTGLGDGIAIPHCRVSLCHEPMGMLITLDEGIDFDAVDNKPVDLVFVLIVPARKEDEHVKTLGKIAEMFSDQDFCHTLRQTADAEDLYNIAITF